MPLPAADATVVDLGCGTGIPTEAVLAILGEHGRVVAVDAGAHTRSAWKDVLVLSGDSLIFRLTARQKRTQRIIAAVSAPTGAALAGLGIAADKYVIGYFLMLVAVGALIAACMSLNNARAFTECTPSSLRARTVLGRLREWPWPQVANISVKEVTGRGSTYSAVMVTTTAGRRIRLAAPTSGIVTPEEFTTSARQIQDYWRAATAAAGQRSEP